MVNRLLWRVPGERGHEARSVRPDTAVNPPGLHVEPQPAKCPVPCVKVHVVGVDQGAVDIEQHRGGDVVDPDIGGVGDVLIGVNFPAGRSETTVADLPLTPRLPSRRPGKPPDALSRPSQIQRCTGWADRRQ
jgi:hypothetical protein